MGLVRDRLQKVLYEAADSILPGLTLEQVRIEHPEIEDYGDYSTNLALVASGTKATGDPVNSRVHNISGYYGSPRELADKVAVRMMQDDLVEKVEVARPGFINLRLRKEFLIMELGQVQKLGDGYGRSKVWEGRKMMVEFAHPNTHKELHIGHMRTLITGEAVARISEFAGAEVFRANYQGDIGPHVAKAIWGTEKLLAERGLSWEQADKLSDAQKAHLLGEGYVRGNSEYEANKLEIDALNSKIYAHTEEILPVYELTRRWSLNYYDTFYKRFGTKFDKLYFEGDMAAKGMKIVEENTGKVFEKSEGAIIFDGEKYGLHKRVFVTKDGNPTYEGKEMALAFAQFADFPFDVNVHVVANEQKGYFEVVIKAIEQLDPKFVGRQYHLSMGMVNLIGRKMSSRTGEILTVDGLLDDVKAMLPVKVDNSETAEAITLGAVKYSILKTQPAMNVAFDIKQSVNLEGSSGPYLQYTYARTQSVLAKSHSNSDSQLLNFSPNKEELSILRWIYRFPEIVEEAAKRYAPNIVCTFLYELAGRFNTFYNQHSILNADKKELIEFRLKLTAAVGQVLKNGLGLLGIEALEHM